MTRTTALITGASRGIGAAIAQTLASDGVSLIGIHYGRDEAAARRTATLITELGSTAVLIRADLSTGEAAGRLIASEWMSAVAAHGHLGTDIFVSNAGINGAQPLAELSAEAVEPVIAINLTAPLHLLHELAGHLNDGGRVIGISTGYVRIAAPGHVAYTAAKAGFEGALRAVAPDLAKRGITVNSVRPGVIDTDINSDWIDSPGARESAAALSVYNRLGKPQDVAEIVRFLASDGGGWITGQAIDATGGTAL